MKYRRVMLVPCFIVPLLAATTRGVDAPAPAQTLRQDKPATSCQPCHIAERPTYGHAELTACTRVEPRGTHSAAEGPDTLVMGAETGHYERVIFSHRAHAEMAEMGEGCIVCHHEATEGRPMRKCDACHSPVRLRADLEAPDLLGAIHRQCVTCHRTWDPDVRCGSCHGAAATAPGAASASYVAWVGNRFHQDRSCSDCHKPDAARGALDPACASCHADWPKHFDHARTGVELDETHAEVDCGDCHGDTTFAMKPTCTSCHDDKSYPENVPGTRREASRP